MEAPPATELITLASKTAIVTGGAAGIGFGIAYRLAEAGANVLIVDINENAAGEAAKKLGAMGWSAAAFGGDVSKSEDVDHMLNAAVHAFHGVDILVNNAGMYPNILVMHMTEEDFSRVLDVNLKSIFLCTKAVAAHMIRQGGGGRIINITSIDALHPTSAGLAHYDASKHGVWGFTKNVALELAPHRIWVNAIAPGGIKTPGVETLQKNMRTPQGVDADQMLDLFLRKIPMQRMGEPDDVGRVALFLASDLASYLTGSQIVVDGGFLLA